jgi:hypothetical protein
VCLGLHVFESMVFKLECASNPVCPGSNEFRMEFVYACVCLTSNVFEI